MLAFVGLCWLLARLARARPPYLFGLSLSAQSERRANRRVRGVTNDLGYIGGIFGAWGRKVSYSIAVRKSAS